MPFVSVYIHFVWSTKDRVPYLETKEIRNAMWQHIRDNGKAKGIFIDFVNGHQEHCHCLVSLGVDQTISKVMQLIKGESAFWFNKQGLISKKLEWQDEYFAVSVSQSAYNNVRNYIKNQEEHHMQNLASKNSKMSEKGFWLKPNKEAHSFASS
jgi:putative transposase